MKIFNFRFPKVFVRSLMRNRLRKVLIFQTVILLWVLLQMTTIIFEEDEEALLRYQPPPQSGVAEKGRRLEVNKTFWRRQSLTYLTLTEELAADFVIVTAGNAVFYPSIFSAIVAVQNILPDRPLYFYDLEDRGEVDDFIAGKFNALCGVTYRLFNFSRYPKHVRKLRYYAWKPLIIYEMLKEFPGVLWIDSSIRLITNNFTSIFKKAVESEGMLALTSAGHSNFAVTHPQMYSFLPTSMEGMIKTDQHEANCVLLYRTRPAFENVVWWWMLCALDPLCIAPTDRTGCRDPYAARFIQADCHRFDQSALNILLANYFSFDYMRYFGSSNVTVAVVHRYSESSGHIVVCRPGVARISEPYHSYLQKFRKSAIPALSVKKPKATQTVVLPPTHGPSPVNR